MIVIERTYEYITLNLKHYILHICWVRKILSVWQTRTQTNNNGGLKLGLKPTDIFYLRKPPRFRTDRSSYTICTPYRHIISTTQYNTISGLIKINKILLQIMYQATQKLFSFFGNSTTLCSTQSLYIDHLRSTIYG